MNHLARAAALAAIVSFVPACTSSAGKKVALVGGGALVVGGTGMLIAESTWEPPDRQYDPCTTLVCNEEGEHNGRTLAGIGMIVAGLVVALIGAGSTPREAPDVDLVAAPPPPPAVAPREARPLPERATDARSLQLAKQARAAALHLECAAVNISFAELEDRDAAYADAVVAAGVLAPCR